MTLAALRRLAEQVRNDAHVIHLDDCPVPLAEAVAKGELP